MMANRKFDNFIFDMDGTIWNTAKPAAAGFTRAIQAYGLKNKIITPDDIRGSFGKTKYGVAADLVPELPPDEGAYLIGEKCVPLQYEEMLKDIKGIIYPGVTETMHRLAKHHGLYIISNCLDGYIDMLFDHTDLKPLVAGTAWFNNPKDSKAANIQYMVEKHGLKNVAYVGDIESDRQASLAAGVDFIYASYGFGQVPAAKYRIDSFGELLNFASIL